MPFIHNMSKLNIEVYSGKKIEEVMKEIQQKHGGDFTIIEQTKKRRFLFGTTYIVKILLSEDKKIKKEVNKNIRIGKDQEAILKMLQEESKKNEKQESIIDKEYLEKTTKEVIPTVENKPYVLDSVEERKETIKTEDEKYISEIRNKLIYDEEVEKSIVERIITEIKMNIPSENWGNKEIINNQAISSMNKMMSVTGEIDVESEEVQVIALVGPTGVGKTTTLAKITAMFKQKNKKIGLISTDVYRIGAIEQLQTYADIMDCKMIEARNPEELRQGIDYFKHVEKVDIIMVDTVGRSAMQLDSIEGIKEYMDVSNPNHTALVLSSTQKYRDMEKIINNFESVQINSLIFTKLDETMSYGFILNILKKFDKKISYVTNGQNVPKDIVAPTPEFLSKQIIIGDGQLGSSSITA